MTVNHRVRTSITRRQFFGRTAHRRRDRSLLASDWFAAIRADRRPADCPACRTSRQGQARNLPPPVRRAVADSICSTTSPTARSISGTRTARLGPHGPADHRHDVRPEHVAGGAVACSSSSSTGKSGAWVSELLPHTAKIVDDIAIVRTMNTEAINHDPAITFIQTGSSSPDVPAWAPGSATAWAARNHNLPAFVVLLSQAQAINTDQPLFSRLWGSGFLPSNYQGVRFRSGGDPGAVSRRRRRASIATTRRRMLDAVGEAESHARRPVSATPRSKRASRSTRWRSDADLGAGSDGSVEGAGEHVEMYGPDVPQARHYAANCLLARRWPSAACVSSSSIIAAGTSTTTCRAISRCSAEAPISPPRRWSRI